MGTSNNNNSTNNQDENKPGISPELSKQLIQMYAPGDDAGKRIPKETAKAVSEVIKILVLEARSRASITVRVTLTFTLSHSCKEY